MGVYRDRLFVGKKYSGQEAVVLSQLLYPYDNGNLDNVINNGDKDEGTDLHSSNAKACGISRGDAKPVFFGLLYGSSPTLTGFTILGNKDYTDYTEAEFIKIEKKLAKRAVFIDMDTWTPEEVDEFRHTGFWPSRSNRYYPIKKGQLVKFTDQLIKQALFGESIQAKLKENLIGFKDLSKDLAKMYKDKKGITTRGGRFIPVDSPHKMLNYSCQGAGAEAMKTYIRIIHERFKEAGLVHGVDFIHQATIYDEIDMIAKKEHVDKIVDILNTSYAMVSDELNMDVTFTGETLTGSSWAQCH